MKNTHHECITDVVLGYTKIQSRHMSTFVPLIVEADFSHTQTHKHADTLSCQSALMTSPERFNEGELKAADYGMEMHPARAHARTYIHTTHTSSAPFGSSLTSSDTGCNVILHDTDVLT